ncbi:MAG: energy-coupling factor transporter ATPase [Thermodesulfobacteriota bacterium]|nr:energy-coupling factor transporter ATPase [Thermodesulfobacteriota bacterium]
MGLISLKGVNFCYKNGKVKALDDINLEFESGEVVVIMGPTGAGKSTLCHTLNGLIPHLIKGEFNGSVTINGLNTQIHKTKKLAPVLGLIFQDFETQLFSTNVELEVAFGPENIGLPREEIKNRVNESLKFVRLNGFEQRQPATLSGGQKQRLAIASVLSLNPQILCMDEPTTDLDPIGRKEIFAVTRELNSLNIKTIIIVEHETEEIIDSDRIVLMEKGKILTIASTHQVLRNVSLLRNLGIMPVQVTELFFDLGSSTLPLTPGEAKKLFEEKGWSISEDTYNNFSKKDSEQRVKWGKNIIQAKNLSHWYDGRTPAIQDVDLIISEGEFLAIVGQNGSGKTTLVKHFNGLLLPTTGSVYVEDKNTQDKDTCALSRIVGYVFQNPDHQIFAERIADEVAFGPKLHGLSEHEVNYRVEEALEAVGLQDFRDEDPFVLTKGQRQRVAVASVLASKPKVIVLDEPTTGLDYKELRGMMELVKKLNAAGHTIIIVTHTMWVVAEYAHRVVVMGGGRIVLDGPTREVFSKEEELKALFLKPPAIVSLGNSLGYTTLSIEEFKNCMEKGREM